MWGGGLVRACSVAVRAAGVTLVVFATRCGAEDAPPTPRSPLRWGADQEGGGPYIFPQEVDPTKFEGFEVDLAAAIGELWVKPAAEVNGVRLWLAE